MVGGHHWGTTRLCFKDSAADLLLHWKVVAVDCFSLDGMLQHLSSGTLFVLLSRLGILTSVE